MKRAKKILSLLLSAAIVLSLIVVPSITASAATLTAPETYAVNTLGAEIGETLLFETFDKGSSSRLSGNQAISNDYTQKNGWEFYDTNKFLWHANASTFQVHDSIFQFWCSNGEGLVVLPQLNATDYIYTAKIKRGGWGNAVARVSLITGMGADVSTDPTYQRFGVQYDSNTSDGVYTVDDVVYRRSDGSGQVSKAFTGSYDMVDYIDFTVISYKGTNYYFIEDEFVFSDTKVDVLNERLGVHIITADAAIDQVTVKKLNAPVVKTAAEKYAENTLGAELGDVLLEESFSKASMSAAVSGNATIISSDYTQNPGWQLFDTGLGLWHNNAVGCNIKDGYMNFYCYSGESLVVLPQLNAKNYIFTAKIKRAGNGHATSSVGLVTDIANEAASSTTYQRFLTAFDASATGAPHTLTAASVRNNSTTTNHTITGTYNMSDYVNFTVISYNGNKYFFVEEELIATAAGIVNEGERLGFYLSSKTIFIDDVVVKGLNVPPPAEEKFAATLGAEIGDVLLEEHFDKGDMAKVTGNTTISGDYTQKAGWEFVDNAPFIWHNNDANFRISNGAANFWCSSGNATLILPQLNESNYVFTAKIKRSGWGSTGASAGILTDLCANLDASTPQIKLVGYYDSATDDGAFPFTKVITKSNGGADREITLENTYDMVAYVDFGVVSYKGTNYYFLNGDYIGSAAKVGGEGERLGFYLSTADITVDDVVVKGLNVPPPAEEKFAATLGAEIGDVLLEEHFDKGDMATVAGNTTISSDYTQMPGWEFVDTAPFIWHNNPASVKILNGAAQFWCSSGNAALILPQLNESNYVFTAKIRRSGWGSTGANAGILTDLCANLDASTPQIKFGGYYDSATEDGTFPFTKVITKSNGGADREITLENTYDLVSYVDFGVVSYEGTNYYFLNGDYIGSAAKVGGVGERLGFYLSTADITVDDVYVKALNVPFESELTDVYGMNAVKVGEAEDNQTYKVNFDYIAENNFSVGFFTADENNANSVGYAEGANVSVYTAQASEDVATATTYVTVDKKGGKDDAIGSDLYMYVIGDAEGVEVANVTAEKLTNVKGDNALVSTDGAAILKDAAENESQAMRYFFNYDSINGNDIIIDGEVYTVKSRGFLVTNGTANASAQITRSAANGTTVKDINVTKLANCWNAVANNDTLNSSELTYSIYVTGFKPVNGTYNNTNRLYVKGYVVVEIDGVDYTFYSAEVNMTVSEVANMV